MKEIETNRTLLRNFKESDLKDFYEYAKTPGIGEKAGWKHHENIEISKVILYNQFLLDEGIFAIVDKKSHHVIGSISYKKSTELTNTFKKTSAVEIGYVLSKKYHNQGIMSEVLKCFVDFIFNHLNYKVCLIRCDKNNYASQKVAQHNDFIKYRIMENVYFPALDEIRTEYCFYKKKDNTQNLLK